MNKALSRNKIIVHIILIILSYLAIRIPLANKPLQHDEVYSTFIYLKDSPLAGLDHQRPASSEEIGFSWATDYKRQLTFHPPLKSIFYYFWIRVFGDSEISLHIPVILLGLIGVILVYLVGSFVFGGRVGFFSALATSFSIAHISYSTQAIRTIFQHTALLASLVYFCGFIVNRENKRFSVLLALNAIGIFTFYHYWAYLFIQTVILWFNRDKLRVPRAYFIVTPALMAAWFFIVFVHFSMLKYRYGMVYDLGAILETFKWLPVYSLR